MNRCQFSDELAAHRATFDSLDALSSVVAQAVTVITDSLKSGGKVLVCGNGGFAHLCEPSIVVPSTSTARIQEAHIFLIRTLCAGIEQALSQEGVA